MIIDISRVDPRNDQQVQEKSVVSNDYYVSFLLLSSPLNQGCFFYT